MDLTQLSESGALLTMLLMLVGASPGSTGGGMKLTTVAVMVMAVSAHLRRRSDVDLFSRRVDPETVRKAFCNALFYVGLMLAASFVILAVQSELLMKDVFFECISGHWHGGFVNRDYAGPGTLVESSSAAAHVCRTSGQCNGGLLPFHARKRGNCATCGTCHH